VSARSRICSAGRREPSCRAEPDDGRGVRRQMSSNSRMGHLQNTRSMSTLQFKRKAREGWRTPRGLSTGVFAWSGFGLIADPIDDQATLKSMASARSRMPNGIYRYLYQIAQADCELNRHEIARTRVSRIHLSIGVFVTHYRWRNWGCWALSVMDVRRRKSLRIEKQRRHVRLPSAGPRSSRSAPDRQPHRSPGGAPPRSAGRASSAPWRCASPSGDRDRAPPSGCSRR
jgi:hypothetical protein